MMTIKVVQTNGSNGYSSGTWEYQITDEHGNLWFDGGYSSRAEALAAGNAKMKRIG
jgi:hypothetical protein